MTRFIVKIWGTSIYFIIIFQKSKRVSTEILKYIFFMSPHTFPIIFFGLFKNIVESLPVSIYDKMMKLRTRLKKQFEVECLQWVIKLLEPLT